MAGQVCKSRIHPRALFALTIALVVQFSLWSVARSECSHVCGDANASGFLSSSDVVDLFAYIASADSSNLDLECANVDDHEGVCLRDLVYLLWDIYLSWPLDCQIDNGPFHPTSSIDYLLHYNSVVPAGDTAVTLYVDATFGNLTQGVSVVLKVTVDGLPPLLMEAQPHTSPLSGWELSSFGTSGTGNIPPGYLMGAFLSVDFGCAEAGRHPLGQAKLVVPASAQPRVIVVEPADFPVGSNITMAHDGVLGDTDAWAFTLAPWIVDITGDVNNDQLITSADIISLVGYVFKGGHPPYPHGAAGDVNCSGVVNSSDIIALVNYVFKGGATPCDVAANCTVTIDGWTCP